MSLQTQSIDLKLHQFDFNNQDVKFINRHLENGYPRAMHAVADMLHWWGKERVANPATIVNYDVVAKLHRIEGKVLQPSIVQFMTLGAYLQEPEMEIYLSCGAEAVLLLKNAGQEGGFKNEIEAVTGVEALARYDAAFAKAKATMTSNMIAAHYSLRAAVAKIVDTLPNAYVRKGSLLFHANVSGVTAVMKIISTQVEFELKTPAVITGAPT